MPNLFRHPTVQAPPTRHTELVSSSHRTNATNPSCRTCFGTSQDKRGAWYKTLQLHTLQSYTKQVRCRNKFGMTVIY